MEPNRTQEKVSQVQLDISVQRNLCDDPAVTQ